jgi:hypothetical protein
MSLFDILSVAALAASLVLLFDAGARVPAFAILLASGYAWTRTQAKPGGTAATAAVLAGAIQILRGFRIV